MRGKSKAVDLLGGGLPRRESNPPMVLEKGAFVSSNSLMLCSKISLVLEKMSLVLEKKSLVLRKKSLVLEKKSLVSQKMSLVLKKKSLVLERMSLVLRKISDTTNSRIFNDEISIIHHPRACAYTRTIQEFSCFCCHKCHILVRNDLKSIGYVCG